MPTVTQGLSTYLQSALLGVFRGSAFPAPPTSLYLAIFVTAPGDGAAGTEPNVTTVAPTYTRLAIPTNTVNLTAPTSAAGVSTIANGGTWTMAPLGNAANVTIAGIGIFDAAAGGNLLTYSTFGTPIVLGPAQTLRFAAGQITVSAA
jgi:hypothetical protein